MVARRPAPHRLRRGRAHVAVDAPTSRGIERRRRRHRQRPGGLRAASACRCRSCGSTRSPSASPSEIQKVRRTGLTFAPEAGTWRMRQVINKLITEEDLYAAVEAAYSQGWRRVKLYFLTGLPTETDEDTLGIAELARERASTIGRKYTQAGVGAPCRSAGSCPSRTRRSSGSARTPSTSCSRKIGLLRDAPATARGVQLKWHDPRGDVRRGHRQPRRPPDRRGHRAGVARAAARSRSGASTSTSTAGSTRWRPRAFDSTGTCTATAPRTRSCPWDHIAAGLHRDFLWQDWQAALRRARASPTAGGRRATTAGCAPATRIEHVVASPVPPAGGSQGTGQDLGVGGAVPVRCCRGAEAAVAA